MRPEFGCAIHDLVFDTIDAEHGRTHRHGDPRGDRAMGAADRGHGVDFDLERQGEGVLEITIGYRVRATTNDRVQPCLPVLS